MRERGLGADRQHLPGAVRVVALGRIITRSKAGMEDWLGDTCTGWSLCITVNSVAPSLIATDMVQAGLSQSLSRIPVGRFGTSEEVARWC